MIHSAIDRPFSLVISQVFISGLEEKVQKERTPESIDGKWIDERSR